MTVVLRQRGRNQFLNVCLAECQTGGLRRIGVMLKHNLLRVPGAECLSEDCRPHQAAYDPLATRAVSKFTAREHLSEPVTQRVTDSMADPSRETLETFENPFPQRNFVIETVAPEFTSMCPKTGQPDFGTLTITYIADKVCYELKSLKLYLQQYRNHGAFYERVTNMILDDLVTVTQPRWMKIEAAFTPRGGIRTTVIAEHGKRPV